MKYNCTPSARSKHITNSYLEATIEDHKNTTHFSETMMAPADDNNAMPPQPLVAPLDVDVTQRLAGGYAMRNRGQNGSPAAQMTPLSRVAKYRERERHILDLNVARCLLYK